MIVLFTDFGLEGPYLGQMKAVLRRLAPQVDVIDLMADAPAFDVMRSAYLLAALVPEFPAGTVFLAIVDPGVGGSRTPAIVRAGERWFVGPENGLFELVVRQSATPARWWAIAWRPQRLSASFHGRDLFAPVAARLAACGAEEALLLGKERPIAAIGRPDWPDELAEIIYIDRFGNGMTGVRAATLAITATLRVGDVVLPRSRTFSDVAPGSAFWYENSLGLVELSVNGGRADIALGLGLGTPVRVG